jgi:hypothetical protein
VLNKTKAEKKQELEEFIRRFSECGQDQNKPLLVKKMISKLNISEIKPSSSLSSDYI